MTPILFARVSCQGLSLRHARLASHPKHDTEKGAAGTFIWLINPEDPVTCL